ncbi:MAG: glycosyltransferase family 9 protein [Candidatus Saganbacteria bacterium]|nr:glycosyltransferase family 9 protein [Candidatus Saganbacteria bacterium]
MAKKEKYDLAIDLMGVDATAQLCVISGAKYRVGVYGRKSPYYNFVLKKASQGVNVMDYFMGMFKKLDLNCFGNKQTEIFLTPQEKQFADKKLMKCKNRIVGIQPACTAPKERWPETKFAQLADILIEKYKLNVVIFQGPGEEKVAKGMIRQMKQKAILLPFKGMRKYLALLSKCDLFVANEGGQIHMAMALKFPTIGISSLSNPNHKYWLYYKNNFKKIISNDIRAVSVIQVLKALSP